MKRKQEPIHISRRTVPYTGRMAEYALERYEQPTVVVEVADGQKERDEAASLTTRAALACAAVSAEPIPWLDTLVILPLQIKLVTDIGRTYGFTLTRERARSVALELGGAFVYGYASRQVVRGVSKFTMPIIGGLVTAPMVYASTYTLGHLAERYFRAQRGDLPPLTADAKREWSTTLIEEGKKLARQVSVHDLRRALEAVGRVVTKKRT